MIGTGMVIEAHIDEAHIDSAAVIERSRFESCRGIRGLLTQRPFLGPDQDAASYGLEFAVDRPSSPSLLRALPLAVTACHPRACRHRRVELANRPRTVR